MTLIKSISGIRGTIGGKPNENLTPIDIVESHLLMQSLFLIKIMLPKLLLLVEMLEYLEKC